MTQVPENNETPQNNEEIEKLKHDQAFHEDENEELNEETEELDEHEELEEEEEEHDFSNMKKSELVAFLDGVIKADKIQTASKWVLEAKERYKQIVDAYRKKALEEFLAVEGNVEMDFEFPLEFVDRQWKDLYRTFSQRKRAEREAKIQAKEDNLARKNALLEELKKLIEQASDKDAFNKLKALQAQWREIGQVPPAEADNLYKNYRHLNDKFFSQRELIKEFLDLDRKKNLEHKKEIIAAINELTKLDSLKEMMRQLKSLQESWHDVGPVPKEELDELMNAYRAANDAITAKKEALVGVLDEGRKENLKLKEKLIEDILNLTDDEKSQTWIIKNQELSKIIDAWKKIGGVPRSENERIRSEFREAVKVFNKLKNTFFKEQKREKLHNYQLKVESCEKVEKLLSTEGIDLKKHRDEIIKLQKYWRTIGPVPRKQSDEVWKRFRTACDEFFNRLKAEDNAELGEQIENLKAKSAICDKIEELAKLEDADNDALLALENEYKKIGFVPFKDKNKIEARFKNAVKEVLKKTVKLGDVAPELESYKNRVEDLLRQTDAATALDKESNNLKRTIQKQQDELLTLENNINFFSNSKGADKLIGDVKNKIELIKKDIALSKKKIQLIRKSYEFTR